MLCWMLYVELENSSRCLCPHKQPGIVCEDTNNGGNDFQFVIAIRCKAEWQSPTVQIIRPIMFALYS